MGDFEANPLAAPWAKGVVVAVIGGVAAGIVRGIAGDGDYAAVAGVLAAGVSAAVILGQPSNEAVFLAGVAERMRLDDKARAPALPGIYGVIARHINALVERGRSNEIVELPTRAKVDAPGSATAAATSASAAAASPTLALDELHEQARAQGQSLDDTSAAMAEMAATVRTIATSVESLASSAEESGSSILEMSAINDEMG